MRYLPLLLLAACAFDTTSMPGDTRGVGIYDGRGSTEVLRDAEDASPPDNRDGATAALDAADESSPDADRPEPADAAPDGAAADPVAAEPDPTSDAAQPTPDAAQEPPPPVETCGACTDSIECADGLSCRRSAVLLIKVCLPDLPASGTCAGLCPGLPLPENGVCNPAPSALGTCSCN